jgi:molecular chaperone GrpE
MAYMNEEDEDIVEFEYNADGEEDLKATLKKLRKDLKEAQKEKQEYLTSWQRERADFMNYRKGEIEHNRKIESMAKEHFAEELLPVLDAYDMAFSNKEAWEKVEKNWRMGVEYIHQQLLKVLSENGIEEIPIQVGDAVDPNLHEAISTVPTEEESKDHTIAQVIQKGYKNGDKIVRPARVVVFEQH